MRTACKHAWKDTQALWCAVVLSLVRCLHTYTHWPGNKLVYYLVLHSTQQMGLRLPMYSALDMLGLLNCKGRTTHATVPFSECSCMVSVLCVLCVQGSTQGRRESGLLYC